MLIKFMSCLKWIALKSAMVATFRADRCFICQWVHEFAIFENNP